MSFVSDVLIIGGGLAGLCCALRLHQSGLSFQILEASDGVGGRVRTDKVEGFLLDRGFQVLLTAYPEARKVLDYDALNLHPFYPGALIRYKGRSHRFADPWRHPIDGIMGLFSPIGSVSDKLKVRKLRQQVLTGSLQDLYRRPETTTVQVHSYAGNITMSHRSSGPWSQAAKQQKRSLMGCQNEQGSSTKVPRG